MINLQLIQNKLSNVPNVSKWLCFTAEEWKLFRDNTTQDISFTDEQLKAAEMSESRYIGLWKGIDCYIAKPFA